MDNNNWLTDFQKIGVGLTGFGVLFLLIGVLLFFDAGLLAMGNMMFLAGVVMVIGGEKSFNFFFQMRKWKGTATFFLGIVLVFLRWPIFGMIIEIFGFVNLFGDFFPIVLRFMRSLPVVGRVFEIPVVKELLDRYLGGKLPV